MTTGLSGTYGINGTDLTLQPTEGRWVERESLGIDGGGHEIYSGIRQFEMTFVLTAMGELKQVIDVFNSVAATGTVAVDLPQWGASDYRFFRYSGCCAKEPSFGPYFEGYGQDVIFTITNIRV